MDRRAVLVGGARLALAGSLSALASACGRTSEPRDPSALGGTLLGQPLDKPAEVLVDTDGEPFDLRADTAGRLTLLFFGYTNCPDICPVHLGVLATALEHVEGPARDTLVLFVGVDVARDTPERVRSYLDRFDRDFIGLTGPADQLDRTQAALGLPAPTLEEPDAEGNYAVGHASQILVFSQDDRCHVVYPFGVRRQTWEHDLPLLAANTWTGHPEVAA